MGNQGVNNHSVTAEFSQNSSFTTLRGHSSFPLFPLLKCLLLLLSVLCLYLLYPIPSIQADLGNSLTLIGVETSATNTLVWGDWDADGDLDLAIGNDEANQVYENDSAAGTLSLVWQSVETNTTYSVAWGDWDSDGDLDLAVGNYYAVNQVYENEGGTLMLNPASGLGWQSEEVSGTTSVAWGDWDDDGDLDLAVGNLGLGEVNQVYENEEGTLVLDPANELGWQSTEISSTRSVAWGDWDNDGDLDLAVGNWNEVNQMYENEGGTLVLDPANELGWQSTEISYTTSVAWGDWDGDGDLDLAVGNNNEANQVYENEGGTLVLNPVAGLGWQSTETNGTASVAWGDWDGDGDLDLAVGNNGVNQVYENDQGTLKLDTANKLGWQSAETNKTESVAWGDVDGDGDLDLAVGNGGSTIGDVNQLYKNDAFAKTLVLDPANGMGWRSTEINDSRSVAWGDWDGDGDLDLAVGNLGDVNQVYENEGGTLILDPANELGWQSTEISFTLSVAWGDWDGDGDLDLATGDGGVQVYENEGGTLVLDPAIGLGWKSAEPNYSSSVAWGDWDGDGDLDLATGGGGVQVYENEAETLTLDPANGRGWQSTETNSTHSIAWGDWDGDGDLDLAVGNCDYGTGQINQVYENDGGALVLDLTNGLGWQSTAANNTTSVAWGDWDIDGDLDLAVGNWNEVNRVYENEGGTLVLDPANELGWQSTEANRTQSVAWGDWDGDGDLDLAVGNSGWGEVNQVYENNTSVGTLHLGWQSTETNLSESVAWGDWDGDGDLDLAVGNSIALPDDVKQVYENPRLAGANLPDNGSFLTITHPITTAKANWFASSAILRSSIIPITYTLFDPESDPVHFIRAYYSPNGGGQWLPTTAAGGAITTNLAASPWPTGTTYTFLWNAEADLIKNDNVTFRIEAYQGFDGPGPYQWPYASAQTFPFRVEAAEWYAKVVSGTNIIAGAEVFQAGQLITTTVNNPYLTDRAGLIRLNNPTPGQSLVALVQTHEQTTTRAVHEGWASRTYITSLNLDVAGVPQPDTIGAPGQQLVTVRPDDPLILFNIVASVEWDATDEYLEMLDDAFDKASAYLYDVTDGQMAFGQVNIYDNAQYWSDADFQFSTKNTVRPYAFLGGLTSSDEAHTIRVGRFWDGGSGNSGDWNQPNGYRTLLHEFGHYALYLHDEYFLRLVDGSGNFIGQADAFCTDEEVTNPDDPNDATNASIMFYQYNTSELADKNHNWNKNCEYTEQYRLNNGESDWETVLRHYDGPGWTINTPSSRDNLMAGPDEFPTELLPFPEITIHNDGVAGSPSRQLTVLDPQSQPVSNALVALYTSPEGMTIAIDQGLTDPQGQIDVYGAIETNIIRAATFDGALAGGFAMGSDTSYTLTLVTTGASGPGAQADATPPYLNLIPDTQGDTLTLKVQDTPAGSTLLDAVIIPGQGGGNPQSTSLAYSPSEGGHVGTVNLTGVGLGTGRVRVSGDPLPSAINSDYNLQQVRTITANHLYSEDGNFELHIPPEGILVDGFATVLPTGYVPGPLPVGRQVIGSAYQVRLSGAVLTTTKESLVRLHYHPEVMGVFTNTAIYYWDPASEVWQNQGGEEGEVDNALAITATQLGIYVLMGAPDAGAEVYLPIIVKE